MAMLLVRQIGLPSCYRETSQFNANFLTQMIIATTLEPNTQNKKQRVATLGI
jgi:hypothetical protein